jgi:hypothetical protein
LQLASESPPTPVVAELVHNAQYNDVRRFQQLVSDNVGSETGWQAIARMFRLTQSAVQMAGMGTNVAIQIKEMTLNYFEDRFADWIVGQGGWVSIVNFMFQFLQNLYVNSMFEKHNFHVEIEVKN